MKLKHFIYSICLASLALTSCQKEDELENIVDLSSPYVLDYLKDSTNEIDQRRYQIYQTYGVAVFLHDKVKEVQVGTDYKGDPIYKNEELDISWEFYSDKNSSYEFTYLQTQEFDESLTEEQIAAIKAQELADANLALDYAETYLSMAGKTKPFSILLLKEGRFDGISFDFKQTFRTLYMANAASYPDPADMRMQSGVIINASVLPLVQLDEALLADFEAISEEKHYYNKQWSRDLGVTFSSDLQSFTKSPFNFKLSNAFDDRWLTTKLANNSNMSLVVQYYNAYGMDYASMFGMPSLAFCQKYLGNLAAVKEVAMEMVDIAARYGFIGGGWSSEMVYTPNASKDVENYVSHILQLGRGGMEARYGAYPLVMEKMTLIADYIENVLGVSVDYNNN